MQLAGIFVSEQAYKTGNKQYLRQVQQGNIDVILLVLQTIEDILVNDRLVYTSMQRLQSLRFIRECVKLNSSDFLDNFQEGLLKTIV